MNCLVSGFGGLLYSMVVGGWFVVLQHRSPAWR